MMMAGSTFGKIFKIHTFGESHGKGIGVVIDGCPAGLMISSEDIQRELDRRKPGQSKITTDRKETDTVQILSGIFEGITLGTPIALFIKNQDHTPKDYDHLANLYRPSHGDFTWEQKYGIRDHRGGGRSSARETAARVAAGAIASKLIKHFGIEVLSYVSSVGSKQWTGNTASVTADQIESNEVRCPDPISAAKMISMIDVAKKEGESLGGTITGIIRNCPIGLGEPVFDKLHADLGKAILSINACKGFEIGSGFDGTQLTGSEHNDSFIRVEDQIKTSSNNSGGIQAGISNGMDIVFRAAFKPVASINKTQQTVNIHGETVELQSKGRHDPCVLPRAVPIVDAMASLVIADHLLRARLNKL
jgi:chorismate synthase